PGVLGGPDWDSTAGGLALLKTLPKGLKPKWQIGVHFDVFLGRELPWNKLKEGPPLRDKGVTDFSTGLDSPLKIAKSGEAPKHLRKSFDPKPRQLRQFRELDRHNQQLLAESPYVRRDFMSKLDTSSLAKFEKSAAWYRDYFAKEVIGTFDIKRLPAN